MRFWTSTSNSAALPYRYNGKELEAMNGLNEYDYGARRREIGIPVWTTVDSKAEDYYSWSPYAYCRNNSICRIDPDGRADWEAVGEGAVATLGGGLLAAVGVGLCSTGIGVLGGGTLVILGTGIASVGAAKTFCGLVSDNSPQSKQALNRLPASAIETVGIIASEATGDKNAKTIATGVDLVISALTTNFKSISQMVSLAASTVSAVNASLNKSQSNSSAKIDNGKTTNSKSTSSKQSNSNSPIPPPKEELKIPSLIEITRHN
jgi:RHS repeat-associated protein